MSKEGKCVLVVIVLLLAGVALYNSGVFMDIQTEEVKEFPVFYDPLTDGSFENPKEHVEQGRFIAVPSLENGKTISQIVNERVAQEIEILKKSSPEYTPGEYVINDKSIYLNCKNRYDEIKKVDNVSDQEIRQNIIDEIPVAEIIKNANVSYSCATDFKNKFVTEWSDALLSHGINDIVDTTLGKNHNMSLRALLTFLCDEYNTNFVPKQFSWDIDGMRCAVTVFDGRALFRNKMGYKEAHRVVLTAYYQERYDMIKGTSDGKNYTLNLSITDQLGGYNNSWQELQEMYYRKTGKIL